MAGRAYTSRTVAVLLVVVVVTATLALVCVRWHTDERPGGYDLSSRERAVHALVHALQTTDPEIIQSVCTSQGWQVLQMCLEATPSDQTFERRCHILAHGISEATHRRWVNEREGIWVLDYGDGEFVFARLYFIKTANGWKLDAIAPTM